MAQAMKGVTKAMMSMNKQMKLPEIQKIMQEFEKQSEIMDMKEEMMSDVLDDALGEEGDEEETDAIVTQVTQKITVPLLYRTNVSPQVLDELGLQLGDQLAGVPNTSGTVGVAAQAGKVPVAAEADADADLAARLENPRREQISYVGDERNFTHKKYFTSDNNREKWPAGRINMSSGKNSVHLI